MCIVFGKKTLDGRKIKYVPVARTSSLVTQKNQQSDLQMYMGRNQHRNAQCINNRPTNHERKRNATQTRISCGTENLWPVRIRVMK